MEEKLHVDFEKEQEILKKVRSDARKRKFRYFLLLNTRNRAQKNGEGKQNS